MLSKFKNMANGVVLKGFDKLRITEKNVFLSNHVSGQDILKLHDALPEEVVFAIDADSKSLHEEVLKKRKHVIYDVMETSSLKRITQVIEKGEPLLVFPEGKVTHTGSFLKIYKEIAGAILEANPVKLYPIVILSVDNASFIPSPDTKIVLGNAFAIPTKTTEETVKKSFFKKEVVTYERDITSAEFASFILKQFQLLRFQEVMKKEVNLFNELVEMAKMQGDQVVLEDKATKMTYRELTKACYVFSESMKGMFEKEEKIGTFLPTSIGHTIALFSLFRLGYTPALLNITQGEQTLVHCIETAQIQKVITSKLFIKKGGFEKTMEFLVEQAQVELIYLEDVKEGLSQSDKIKGITDFARNKKSDSLQNELVLFTSGSENKPKGVVLSHENIYANIHQAVTMIDLNAQDKIFNMLPTFHSFGLTIGTILPVLTGIPVFLYPSPLDYKDIPKLVYRKEATIMFGTSTFFSYYAKSAEPFDFHTLRLVVAGAEKLQPETAQVWHEKFGKRILEGYGVTESAPVLSINTNVECKKGTVGQFLPGISYKLEAVEGIEHGGKLLVQGPNVMKGYLLHGIGFQKLEGWYDTGDIVEVDDEGYLKIVSRLKRFAKIAGEMVSLELVESLARACYPEVQFGAVTVSDSKKGEKIVLFATTEEIKLRELKTHIKDKKESMLLLPKELYVIEEIPMLGSGKTNYVALSELAAEKETK